MLPVSHSACIMTNHDKRKILLAVTGLSPQIVTETLYALAVGQDTPWIPDEIHLITSCEGAERARLSLLDPVAGLPALRAWCEAQAARRPDMAALRARHAEARAVALAQQAARQAEREAAAAAEQQRLADEAERARRLASLSEALQEVESFADACRQREAQLRGNKDKPNTAHHARAAQLATRAQAWTAEEKAAAAAAIQHWIPRIVAIDPKELRKKLKLAALESGA